jgi:hypothetical protein
MKLEILDSCGSLGLVGGGVPVLQPAASAFTFIHPPAPLTVMHGGHGDRQGSWRQKRIHVAKIFLSRVTILLFDSTRFAEVEAACRMWYEILRGPPLAEKFA